MIGGDAEAGKCVLDKIYKVIISRIDQFNEYLTSSKLNFLYSISKTFEDPSTFLLELYENFSKHLVNNSDFNSFIDSLLAKENIKDITTTIDIIKKCNKNYLNFPLIVINSNISDEEKTKAIKLTFKQKDFPKYKSFLLDNIKDLKDLAIYIDTTVINNNRVHQKEDGIIDILKSVLISGERNIFADYSSFDVINKEYFVDKYMPYFNNKDFMGRFYKAAVLGAIRRSDYKANEYSSLSHTIIQRGDNVDTKIEYVRNNLDSLTSSTIQNIFSDMYSKAVLINDNETMEKLINLFLDAVDYGKEKSTTLELKKEYNCFELSNFICERDFNNFLKTKSAGRDRYLKSFVLINSDTGEINKAFNNFRDLRHSFFSQIGPDGLEEIKFFSDTSYIKFLGITLNDDTAMSNMDISNYFYSYFLSMKIFWSNVNELLDLNSSDYSKKIIDTFFSVFEDENMSSALFENIISISNNTTFQNATYGSYYYYSGVTNKNRDCVLVKEFDEDIKNLLSYGTRAYKDYIAFTNDKDYEAKYNNFTENINNLNNNFTLLHSI